MDENVKAGIKQLAHILERHRYPKDKRFYDGLKKVLKEKTGDQKFGLICSVLLEQNLKMSQFCHNKTG